MGTSLDLTALFREHSAGLAGAVRGVLGPTAEVQEVLQEAFLKAWRSRHEAERARSPAAWIFVLTINAAKDLRRRNFRRAARNSLEEVNPMELQTAEHSPLRHLETREWLQAARAAIVRLGDKEKEVFLLRASGGLSFPAVADALGIPEGTAKTRMRAALARLRIELSRFAPSHLGAELREDTP